MRIFAVVLFLLNISCGNSDTMDDLPQDDDVVINQPGDHAIVTQVSVSGDENNYTFNVTLSSPDTGCDQYADWWEIFDDEEELQYRRILLHSHVNEQPFSRSGGPVRIAKDRKVYIRGHMNNTGYSNQVYSGTVATGFVEDQRMVSIDLEKTDPQPDGCDF